MKCVVDELEFILERDPAETFWQIQRGFMRIENGGTMYDTFAIGCE